MYKIVVHKRAVKYLKKLPVPQKNKIKETLSQLAKNPLEFRALKA
jgi:mRNA-degrading endonuclease RelE of RelBE toxin-antitoxin system